MTRIGRIRSEVIAATRSFLRRRTAVFFTFFFPFLLIVIFGVLVGTPAGGGLFAQPAGYYLPGYLAVVVLFTPLSRVGSEVARGREGNRFEKLATTPLSRAEWLFAQTLVNTAVVGIAAMLVLALMPLTGARVAVGPGLVALLPLVALAVAVFCGVGAVLGRVADSQDGVIAAANAIALPLLFLSETFVTPSLLPAWLVPALSLSPLTWFARGVRAVTYWPLAGEAASVLVPLAVLAVLAPVGFIAGAVAIPRTD